VNETRPRGRQGSSAGAAGGQAREQPLDDWLGDVSDEDWSEDAAERAERRRATPAYEELPSPAGDLWPEPADDGPTPAGPVDPADARRAVVERRRLVAGLVLAVVLGLGVLVAVLLLRGGDQTPATSATETSSTTTAPTESTPSSTPTTTTPGTSTTTPATPSTPDTSTTGFTLPEGTKLRLGEGDPAVVKELQQALTSAGYDPGSADGTYGPKTQAAVKAFQQANGLSADGVVGPETASALNSALTSTATPSTPNTSTTGFTLPEGTKLRLGEGDPAVVKELQQALTSAGYDPGSADGTYGPKTQAAVTAFQQANGLSADGVVGPETASALNSALASG